MVIAIAQLSQPRADFLASLQAIFCFNALAHAILQAQKRWRFDAMESVR